MPKILNTDINNSIIVSKSKSKIKLLVFILLFLSFSKLSAIDIAYDYAQFKYNQDSSLIEIYYSFFDNTLKYDKYDDSTLLMNMQFEAKITNITTKESLKNKWKFPSYKKINDTNTVYSLYGLQKFYLPKGEYQIEIIAYDENNISNKSKWDDKIKLKSYPDHSVQLSDLFMATVIENENTATRKWDDMYRKNQYYILPNPMVEYYVEYPNLDFYFETYNANNFDILNYLVIIEDAAKREFLKIPIEVKNPNPDFGRPISVPINILPTGVYYLRVQLFGKDDTKFDEKVKKFFYYNKNMPPQVASNFTEDQLFEMSEFSTLKEDQINIEFRKSAIIATSNEISQWKKLTDLKAKQRFLYRFWRQRDTDTETLINEKRVEYEEYIKFANTYFTYGNFTEGWNTERGRILLKYGFPTQRDRFVAVDTDKAYEDWFYTEIQGGVHFYFVDVQGFGNYILVHSNALNELKNPDWFNQYVKNINSADEY